MVFRMHAVHALFEGGVRVGSLRGGRLAVVERSDGHLEAPRGVGEAWGEACAATEEREQSRGVRWWRAPAFVSRQMRQIAMTCLQARPVVTRRTSSSRRYI